MLKELFGSSTLLDVPVFVMLFFMLIFVVVLARVASRRRSPHYRAMAQLPLDFVADSDADSKVATNVGERR